MIPNLQNDWAEMLAPEWDKPYFRELCQFLAHEYSTQTIYPNEQDIFSALNYTSYNDTKVVILGQDPYHGPGQAHGLSFSVQPGVKKPPSLLNMLKELNSDLGCSIPNDGFLQRWAEQGVLLLNTVLTVRDGNPQSHKNQGWETLTDHVIAKLGSREQPLVFILWGAPAQKKANLIDNSRHLLLSAPHPSPLSAHRGFFGSRPYSQANAFLQSRGLEPIEWQL